MKRLILTVSLLSLVLPGCKEEIAGEPLEILALSVYTAAVTNPADSPYNEVTFVRIAITDESGSLAQDKFVRLEEASAAALEAVPFGSGLKITLEGWSQNAQGLIGQLISRGRSLPFSVFEDSDPQLVPIMLSRVNAFGLTSMQVEGGSQATSLNRGRVGHTVTLLPNGTVIIVGGATMSVPGDYKTPADLTAINKSVEVYDPGTGIWTEFPDGMAVPRAFHTATTLGDGRVVLSGGITDTAGTTVNTLEIFDPSAGGGFTIDPGVVLNTARAGHTASLVEGGDHMVFAGGFTTQAGTTVALGTIEVVCVSNAACGQPGVVYTGNMAQPRYFHTANRVAVGPSKIEAVVLIGGEGDEGVRDNLETFILNPAEVAAFSPVMSSGGRTRHTATYIPSQNFIHVVGGYSDKNHSEGVQLIDSYQVGQESFQNAQAFYALHRRGGHAAVAMPGNAILLFGGFDGGAPLDSAEVIFEYYDEATNQTYIDRGGVSPMMAPRGACHGVLLPNDTVLVVGGQGANAQPNTIGEFFNPL